MQGPEGAAGRDIMQLRSFFRQSAMACSSEWLGWLVANNQKATLNVLVIFLARQEKNRGGGGVGSGSEPDLEICIRKQC